MCALQIFKNILSRDFGAAEIDVFITEFGLDVKEWNDEKAEESDMGADEMVDCDNVNIEIVGKDPETPDSTRPLSGKQASKILELEVDKSRSDVDKSRSDVDKCRSDVDKSRSDVDKSRSGATATGGEDSVRSEGC